MRMKSYILTLKDDMNPFDHTKTLKELGITMNMTLECIFIFSLFIVVKKRISNQKPSELVIIEDKEKNERREYQLDVMKYPIDYLKMFLTVYSFNSFDLIGFENRCKTYAFKSLFSC